MNDWYIDDTREEVFWRDMSEEEALRRIAAWIDRKDPSAPFCVVGNPQGVQYAGAELRRRALAYLTQDALCAFLADYPEVTHLYRESRSDGTPAFTIVTAPLDSDRELSLYGFPSRKRARGDSDRYCEMRILNPALFDLPDGETFRYTPYADAVAIPLASQSARNAL